MKNANYRVLALVLAIGYSAMGGNMYSLYTDHRAMGVDDILTVLIEESAKAGSTTGTNTNKQNEYGVTGVEGNGALGFIPRFGISGGTKIGYDGKAGTSRQGNLVAKVSARVTRVLDNGNLMIEGSKVVEINEEKEIIKISGVVRPQDIESNNIIYSHNISDAQISYSGKGTVHNGHRPGLITKLLNYIF
jgi:flagellar L-ring protein precursor FlgH